MADGSAGEVRLGFEDFSALLTDIFLYAGVPENNARILAANCAACERDGSISHGIFRIAGYVASLKSGWVDGKAVPIVHDVGAAFIRTDAQNGFAQPALAVSTPLLVEKTKSYGTAVLAIQDSHHFSALWPDLEPLARSGFIAISMVSGLACVAPPGGRKAVMGTNPLAFATPVADSDPLIFDFATSSMSNGDLRIAAREGQTVPMGAGVDKDGLLSSEPSKILDGGALLPFGGHKGAALSLMVEILASALTGGQFSSEVDFAAYPGAETPRTGQLVIAIDPKRGGNDLFPNRVAHLLQTLRNSGQARLPSDRRYSARRKSEKDGISITRDAYHHLRALATSG